MKLKDCFSAGLTSSTLKVYVAAITAYHAPLGSGSLGRYLLVSRFLHDAMRPASHARVLAWDLVVVLEGLSMAHFEPIESVLDKFLMLKTSFLCVFTSLKREGDLQVLSVASSFLEFALGRVKAFLPPRIG